MNIFWRDRFSVFKVFLTEFGVLSSSLIHGFNRGNKRGTFFLGNKGDIYLENSHFYRTSVYVEEELALFITEMVDHLSFLYLVGENYLNNNLELEKAFQTSVELLQAKKNW
mgnify:CR=1 FL=1